MEHVTMRGKIHRDNTGVVAEIPVIVTEHGPLRPLVEYLLERVHVRSHIWMVKLAQAVSLLLDYMAANHDCYDNPKDLFAGFVQRLYTGTVGEDGTDPSGLYWQGRSPAVVRQLVNPLSEFSDWMAERQGTRPLNPWRQATRGEELLAWAAWHQKRDRAFLAHAWDRETASLQMTRARNALLQKTPVIDHETVKFFPDERIHDLLFKGFIVPGKQKSPRLEERLNLRDILITLLLHYGGLRMSEPFHLYVQDVVPDPLHPERARVRVYHPSLGTAPPDWLDAKGKPTRCSRDAYLRGKWGMLPRTEYASTDQWHAGWKGNALDSKAHCMEVSWFPAWAGELFWQLWVFYMAQRAHMRCDHPFSFVTQQGKPYAIDSFERQHRRAVERIGLTPAKALGTTPHAHRHAYGQRLADAKIDPIFRKKALHHKSLESQTVYTEPDRAKLTRALEEASQREREGATLPPPDFLEYGFRDVDPLGLLSGPHPTLLRRG
ncbi:gamma-mobile-trio recombinase GmtY [Crenobacter cavernae]|uniref:Site-specific integrase n=1 Tax=Crenobacter cavernae TaxID=2290923 RepID=A0A345Y8C6_9NEIS|nr:gamma-mobile-trio recombinase GmtY [Crenobacter cavernae]AXK40178.1 site-specific integrase [Crenobacter cavernae]